MAKTAKPANHVDPLSSWHVLQTQIHDLNEKQLQELIDRELKGERRQVIVLRIHMKLNKLRYAREKAAYKAATRLIRPSIKSA